MNDDAKNLMALYQRSGHVEAVTTPIGVGDPQVTALDSTDQLSTRAVAEFVDWASRNVAFLERGRMFGFELAVSPGVKDAIALELDHEQANRINVILHDFSR